MYGLERIEREILQEAQSQAEQLLQEAKIQADAYLEQEQKKAKRLAEEILETAEKKAKECLQRERAAQETALRRELLRARQQAVEQVLCRAKEELLNIGEARYLDFVRKMLTQHMRPQPGKIFFSEADLKSKALLQEVQSIAKKAGADLQIESAGEKIQRGFVLVYDGIEENCSFSAVFQERREEFADMVCGLLF